jgi:hypothetical protein
MFAEIPTAQRQRLTTFGAIGSLPERNASEGSMKASVYKIGTPRRLLVHRGSERRLVAQYPRRRILRLAAGAAAFPAISRMSWAQTYPTRPVRIIVGFASGSINDVVTRLMGQWLSERMGQQFVVENLLRSYDQDLLPPDRRRLAGHQRLLPGP